ncbi:MAG: glycosyltransferase family 4 protein [Pseudomonadota bacterium]
MRIALSADPELPVPPKLYGGIERIIDMLALKYAERGHEVTVFAHPESDTAGKLIAWPRPTSQSRSDTLFNSATLARHIIGGKFDILHSFSRLAYMTPILPLSLPKLMTYQRAITADRVKRARGLAGKSLEFTACGAWMLDTLQDRSGWHAVPNGVPLETYDFTPDVAEDAPLVFLGRIEEIKGTHLAIEIAKRTNQRLIIAGNIPDEKRDWYEAFVAPHLDDKQIKYVGPVNDVQKNELLGEAKAFLMPILWDEPFGIVMAEAMACGTPVIGMRRGAVPEVVVHGSTGFVGDTIEDLIAAMKDIQALDRAACRKRVEDHYSSDAVADAYLNIYQNHGARAK